MIAIQRKGARGGWLILVDVLWYETIEPSTPLKQTSPAFQPRGRIACTLVLPPPVFCALQVKVANDQWSVSSDCEVRAAPSHSDQMRVMSIH